MRIFRGELRDTIDLLVFGPGERLAAAVSGRGRVDVWNCVTGILADPWKSKDAYGRELSVTDIGFLPDERVVACVSGQPLQVFDPNAREGGGIVFPQTHGQLYWPAVELATAPNAVYSTHARNPTDPDSVPTLIRWCPDGRGAYEIAWIVDVEGVPMTLAASQDGQRVALTASLGVVQPGRSALTVLENATGKKVYQVTGSDERWPHSQQLQFNPDGTRIVETRGDGVFIWDVATGKEIAKLALSETGTQLTDAAFHPSGRWLLTSGMDGSVQVWDAESLTPTTAFQWNIGKLRSLAIAADGNIAAAGGEDGNIVVWDLDL